MKPQHLENGRNGQGKPKWRTVARFNSKMMERFQKALEKDASVDLSTVLPENYRSRRHIIQQEEEQYLQATATATESTTEKERPCPSNQILQGASPIEQIDLPQDAARIVFSLSDTARNVLHLRGEHLQNGEKVSTALKSTLLKGELLCSPNSRTHLIKCSTDLVIKSYWPELTAKGMDFTEFTSLQYLEQHIPNIPAPRPHGLIVSGITAYLLMTYIPGQNLEAAWPLLTNEQKSVLRDELQEILVHLRDHPKPSNMRLGGTQGEGCKDTRRATKISNKPLSSPSEFWNFVYGSPWGPTPMYVQTIQSWFKCTSSEKCVFTHGDLRPANIHVMEEGGRHHIVGILDWEKSGFYPASWESCKITNCMSPIDVWD